MKLEWTTLTERSVARCMRYEGDIRCPAPADLSLPPPFDSLCRDHAALRMAAHEAELVRRAALPTWTPVETMDGPAQFWVSYVDLEDGTRLYRMPGGQVAAVRR